MVGKRKDKDETQSETTEVVDEARPADDKQAPAGAAETVTEGDPRTETKKAVEAAGPPQAEGDERTREQVVREISDKNGVIERETVQVPYADAASEPIDRGKGTEDTDPVEDPNQDPKKGNGK
jgi:hypothetical protein